MTQTTFYSALYVGMYLRLVPNEITLLHDFPFNQHGIVIKLVKLPAVKTHLNATYIWAITCELSSSRLE